MKNKLTLTARVTLSALLAAATLGSVQAAPQISAQSIIVNPVPTTVNVRVWTDRDASGTQTPNYYPGENIRLYASVSQDSYVYLFNIDPQGQVDLILPNGYAGGANFLKANTVKVFPSNGDAFTFTIAAPYGLNKVLAVASKTALNIDQIAKVRAGQNSFAPVSPTAQGPQRLAQALSIVVNPVPQNTWDSATAFYNVAQGNVAPVRPVPVQPVQPAPVRPAPVQPAPVQPTYTTGVTRSSFSNNRSLADVNNEYVNRLRNEGFTLVSSRLTGNHIRSEFQSRRGTATLEVKQRGNRFDVTITRR
ncbi:MAG: S-layer protein [Deinococcus sp.]|nr:S-layer protein [Deinococcus sp.]